MSNLSKLFDFVSETSGKSVSDLKKEYDKEKKSYDKEQKKIKDSGNGYLKNGIWNIFK